MGIKIYIPSEFQRKTRTLDEFPHMKATEQRLHLLYVFPVALRNILPPMMYNHYLLLHVAIKLLVNEKVCRTFVSYADSLLNEFVSQCPSIYGNNFVTYNTHNLQHLAADVEVYGCLDKINAFKFENKLQLIKHRLKSSVNPLQQAVRRLDESEKNNLNAPLIKEKCSGLSSSHSDGPNINHLLGEQFKNYDSKFLCLTTRKPDHCVLLNDNTIPLISNFIKTPLGEICFIGRKYLSYENLYTYPLPSKSIQGYVVTNLSPEIQCWTIKRVICKCFRIPMSIPLDGNWFVTPLLMSKSFVDKFQDG